MSTKEQTETLKPNELHDDATYDHIVKYTGLFGGVQGLSIIANVLRNMVAAKLLGPSGTAIINLYNNAIQLLHRATNVGISFSAVKCVAELQESEDRDKLYDTIDTVRTWSLLTGIAGTLICILLASLLSQWTFNSHDYTWSFIILSPTICISAVIVGEMAVLKGMQRMKEVAITNIYIAVLTLLICIPFYIFLGIKGIVLSLLLTNAATLCSTLYYSTKCIPWKSSLLKPSKWKEGKPLLTLGIGFLIASVIGQGADYIVRTLILHFGSLDDVGFFNAGYVLAISYSSVVFVAMENDFFPRLSAICHDKQKQNHTVNQQIEVCLILIAPLLISMILIMPLAIRILYTSEFDVAIPMAVSATFYSFFRALSTPTAYIALAKGDSKMFLLTESASSIFIAIAIPLAFSRWGLIGTGWVLSLDGLLYTVMVHVLYHYKYGYVLNKRPLHIYAIQFLLLAATIFATLSGSIWLKWTIGPLALCTSIIISVRILIRETAFIQAIIRKFKKH